MADDGFDAWYSGNEEAQEEQGYRDGLRHAAEGWWPDGEADTPYYRGMMRAWRESERAKGNDTRY